MCDGRGSPAGVTEALAMLGRALDHLNAADVASLPASVQAEALRALGRAEAKYTAARARVLGAFAVQGGFEDDGHGTARTWLMWQTRVTAGAAVGAIAWARRLAAHPVIGRALAAGELSPSWARHLCDWAGRLPEARRSDAEEILTGAARGGADLAALGGLAREMYERCCRDGSAEPAGDGFADRWFRLGVTFGGAGRAEGDLTPGCAAALAAVLEALGKRAGPEDTRTRWQRRHDALEEACRRLIRAGMVPERAGQPTQILVHLTLAQLRGLPEASAAEDAWAAARVAQPGWLTGPDADAALCDATIVPVVTGHVDQAALDQLTQTFLHAHGVGHSGAGQTADSGQQPGGNQATGPLAAVGQAEGPGHSGRPGWAAGPGGRADHNPPSPAPPATTGQAAHAGQQPAPTQTTGPGPHAGTSLDPRAGGDQASLDPHARTGTSWPIGPGQPAQTGPPSDAGLHGTGGRTCGQQAPQPLSPATRDRLRRALLGLAADALSGPDGLAARLRAALGERPLTTLSLPLDIGAASETIPAHLRRAVTTRHPHCAFPGCDQPATVCDIHHIVPKSRGGPTSLPNLVPVCTFHHLTAIHRWGWRLTLHSDGTTTATSPNGTKTLNSHSPPGHDPPGHDPPSQAA